MFWCIERLSTLSYTKVTNIQNWSVSWPTLYICLCDVWLALETGVGSLLDSAGRSIESAVSAQHAAAKAVRAHTDLLRKAMDVSTFLSTQSLITSTYKLFPWLLLGQNLQR